MTVVEALTQRRDQLTGRRIDPADSALLDRLNLPGVSWWRSVLERFALAGTTMRLDAQLDQSRLGVELRWLNPRGILEEAFELYPGINALKIGLIPVAACKLGSGDPYFISVNEGEDPPLLRVCHEGFIDPSSSSSDGIELVTPTLTDFLVNAIIG